MLTSCAPYETALAGARVARALGRPWVADLEDPWALDEMRLHPTALHGALDRRAMRRALSVQRTIARLSDDSGQIEATWFGRRFIERRLKRGQQIVVSGKLKRFGRALTWTLGAAAANDFLQAAFSALCAKANELEDSTP